MERRQEHDRQPQSRAVPRLAAQAKAMFTAPPDQGHAIQAEITPDGKITMTNNRNGFSKTYQIK